MSSNMSVNAGQAEQQLMQEEREERIFRMKPVKAKFVFTMLLLIFSLTNCILPILFSADHSYNRSLLAMNYLYVGAAASAIGAFLYHRSSRPQPRLSLTYMVLQILAATLIVLSNLSLMDSFYDAGKSIACIILCVCYVILIVLQHMVVTSIDRIIDAKRTIDGGVNNSYATSNFSQVFHGFSSDCESLIKNSK